MPGRDFDESYEKRARINDRSAEIDEQLHDLARRAGERRATEREHALAEAAEPEGVDSTGIADELASSISDVAGVVNQYGVGGISSIGFNAVGGEDIFGNKRGWLTSGRGEFDKDPDLSIDRELELAVFRLISSQPHLSHMPLE